MARQKKTIITGVTREAADEAFATYTKNEAQIQKINADIELQCAKIREKRQVELAQLTQERDKAFDTLQAFASENKAELFAKKKSLDMAHGTIGFRTGNPKLKLLKGFTWASALTLVKKYIPVYVRMTEDVNKEKLLADRWLKEVEFNENETTRKKLPMTNAMAECGIIVAQDETFYVEPKKEEQTL